MKAKLFITLLLFTLLYSSSFAQQSRHTGGNFIEAYILGIEPGVKDNVLLNGASYTIDFHIDHNDFMYSSQSFYITLDSCARHGMEAIIGSNNSANADMGTDNSVVVSNLNVPAGDHIFYLKCDLYNSPCLDQLTVSVAQSTASPMIVPEHGISVYPNPVKDELNISSAEKITSIIISNSIGQTLISETYDAEEAKVNVNRLPSGIYFLAINGVASGRFLKE